MSNVPVVDVPTAWAEQLTARGSAVWRERSSGIPTRARLVRLARRLGSARSAVLRSATGAAAVHEVRAQVSGAIDERGVVIRSTTFEELPLHTDGYNAMTPPRVVLLQVVATGERPMCVSLVRSVDALVERLPEATIEALTEPVFPVFDGAVPLLTRGSDGARHGRINLYEIDIHRCLGNGIDRLRPRHREAVAQLRAVIDHLNEEQASQVSLRVGDVLALDNRRTLHGRARLSPADRDRLLRRMWLD